MFKNPKIRQKKKFDNIGMVSGDILIAEVRGRNGDSYKHREEIGRAMEINTITTFDLDNGVGAAFTLEDN